MLAYEPSRGNATDKFTHHCKASLVRWVVALAKKGNKNLVYPRLHDMANKF